MTTTRIVNLTQPTTTLPGAVLPSPRPVTGRIGAPMPLMTSTRRTRPDLASIRKAYSLSKGRNPSMLNTGARYGMNTMRSIRPTYNNLGYNSVYTNPYGNNAFNTRTYRNQRSLRLY